MRDNVTQGEKALKVKIRRRKFQAKGLEMEPFNKKFQGSLDKEPKTPRNAHERWHDGRHPNALYAKKLVTTRDDARAKAVKCFFQHLMNALYKMQPFIVL